MMTLSHASAMQQSVPGCGCSQYSAGRPHHVSTGSMEMTFVPICTHMFSQWPKYPSPLDFSGSLPHTTRTSGFFHSGLA